MEGQSVFAAGGKQTHAQASHNNMPNSERIVTAVPQLKLAQIKLN